MSQFTICDPLYKKGPKFGNFFHFFFRAVFSIFFPALGPFFQRGSHYMYLPGTYTAAVNTTHLGQLKIFPGSCLNSKSKEQSKMVSICTDNWTGQLLYIKTEGAIQLGMTKNSSFLMKRYIVMYLLACRIGYFTQKFLLLMTPSILNLGNKYGNPIFFIVLISPYS